MTLHQNLLTLKYLAIDDAIERCEKLCDMADEAETEEERIELQRNARSIIFEMKEWFDPKGESPMFYVRVS